MARRRTELEKQPEAGGDRFSPFAEVFTASAAADPDRTEELLAADPDRTAEELLAADRAVDRTEELAAGRTAEHSAADPAASGAPADPEGILSEPPDTRDISAELAAPPRPRLPWLTLLLSGGVVAGLAFAGGALVEKDHLQGSSGSAFAGGQGRTGSGQAGAGVAGRQQGAAGQGGGQGQGGAQGRTGSGQNGAGNGQNGSRQGSGGATGGLGAGAGVTTGTVKLVDGTTVYVTDAQGNVVKVTTDTHTQITQAKSGKVSDLQPGQTVTVRGSQDASGDVAATTVAQGGGAGGFGGGFTGGGRG